MQILDLNFNKKSVRIGKIELIDEKSGFFHNHKKFISNSKNK